LGYTCFRLGAAQSTAPGVAAQEKIKIDAPMNFDPPRSILAINVTRIGDTLLATPALRALAAVWPEAKIEVLGHPRRAEILRHLPFVTRVGSIEKRRALIKGWLPGKAYDLALVYGHDTALITYALRVAERVVAFRQSSESLNERLFLAVDEPPHQTEHAVNINLRLVCALGLSPVSRRLSYVVTDDERKAARLRLASNGLASARPLIGFQMASFPTKAYRDWPLDHFVALGRRIVMKYPAAGFLLFGGPDDRLRTSAARRQLGDCAVDLTGISLRQTGALMAETHAYVGVDTGPTHMMGTFDIPMIGLYHCLLPQTLYGALEHPLNFSLDHPSLGTICSTSTSMADISVDSVFVQLERALSGRPPSSFI
jgi:heptosyltransferase-3